MGLRLDVPVLGGFLVRLEPLSVRHAPDLARAAEEDRSAFGFTVVPRAGEAREYLAAQLSLVAAEWPAVKAALAACLVSACPDADDNT